MSLTLLLLSEQFLQFCRVKMNSSYIEGVSNLYLVTWCLYALQNAKVCIKSNHKEEGWWSRKRLVNAHARCPACALLLLDAYLAGKGVAALGGDGRDVILVGVGKGDDFHGGGEEGLLHGSAYFGAFLKMS